ncbi:hypothetical protein AHAS_Ahas07G0089400 [Arachis hypogaea]
MSARTESSKAKTELAKLLAHCMTHYSIHACMELLDSIKDISNKVYNKALKKFKDEYWRCTFFKMPSFKRNDWLASLEFIMSKYVPLISSSSDNSTNSSDLDKDMGDLIIVSLNEEYEQSFISKILIGL